MVVSNETTTKPSPPAPKDDQKAKGNEKKVDEMSEEDKKLQDELNMLVERLQEPNQSLYGPSLESLRSLIRASTTSMTSVPKPLKFMRGHYSTMKEIYKKITDKNVQRFCGDVISVLAMTAAAEGSRECLKYRMLGKKEPIGAWGHEYVRHLASEIAEEWKTVEETPGGVKNQNELLALASEIAPYHMAHNAEAEACDLLMEIEQLDLLKNYVDEETYTRVCLYLVSCVSYVPDPENVQLLRTAIDIYLKFNREIEALRCAIMLNDMNLIKNIFMKAKDLIVQKQMAFILGRHQIFLDLPESMPCHSDLFELMSNANLSTYFLALARELDIMEPKVPEDIYKSHLEPSRPYGAGAQVDSARQNLAATFVNGLVNTGFCVDKLLTEDANKWFYKNKDQGMMSAAASQGLLYRWDIDNGLNHIDKFLYANEDYIKAGSLLALGIISNGVHHECDPAQALLLDYLKSDKALFRVGSTLGLGLAYTNSKRESVIETVIPKLLESLVDSHASAEVIGLTALSLGLICVGTANADVANAIFLVIMEKSEQDLKDTNLRYLALGIALIFLGKQDDADVIIDALRAATEPYGSMAATLVEVAAYAGTGNVLKIQSLLHICSEHLETGKDEKDKEKEKDKDKDKDKKDDKDKDKKDDKEKQKGTGTSSKPDMSLQQGVAALGIALIAMGEDIGTNMSFRLFGHLLRYGDLAVRRAVPLALGLISVSNPQLSILETLSKFSHDSDAETAYNAIFALGLVGAGTNNARLAAMLRQLAAYHQRDQLSLMLVRVAQGMVHMGKGTLTLNPFHSDRQLMSPSAVAGLLATCFTFLDVKNTILSKQHHLLYLLVPAIQPRFLITFVAEDTEKSQLKEVNVNVRQGQAVDVVGQAGKPKTITGFQTLPTPVLLAYADRAELATDEYISVAPVLEGFVILKKNPNYEGK